MARRLPVVPKVAGRRNDALAKRDEAEKKLLALGPPLIAFLHGQSATGSAEFQMSDAAVKTCASDPQKTSRLGLVALGAAQSSADQLGLDLRQEVVQVDCFFDAARMSGGSLKARI